MDPLTQPPDLASAMPLHRDSRRRAAKRRLGIIEIVIAVSISACVFIVHDVPYVLRAPYWVDEAWVAATTRLSLGHLPKIASTTGPSLPIVWTLLLRSVPQGGQDQRLVPLLFAAAAVLAAYALGHSLRLIPVVTGTLAAGAALLVPAMLVRNDLKEYTTDAFVTLLTLALVSRLEAEWSRRRLITLGGVLVACALISNITLLVAAAALPCVCLTRLARRRKAEFIDAVVVTAVTGVLLLIIFAALDPGSRSASLKRYWQAYYLPHGLHASLHYINTHLNVLLPYFGFHHRSLLFLFVLIGLVVLVRQGRWATAAILPVLVIEVVVLSALHRYPLLDERTSTFLMAASVVIAAIGVAGVAFWIARRLTWIAAAALIGLAASFYILAALPFVRSHSIPVEDVRAQESYVAAHARPGDVVVVNWGANWGYAYYARPQPHTVSAPGIGYAMAYRPSDDIITVVKPGPAAVLATAPRALSLVKNHPGARLWLVANHQELGEPNAWAAALAPYPHGAIEVAPQTIVQYADPTSHPKP